MEEERTRQRNMDNRPSWMTKKRKATFPTEKSDRPLVMVISAVCFNTTPGGRANPMPITIDNNLPVIALRFGTIDCTEMSFKVSLDSCADLNIGNLKIHHWIAATYPHIVHSWREFDDKDKFKPLSLNFAVADNNIEQDNTGKLTVLVSYYIRYKTIDGLPVCLSFGLGRDVAVNAIVGKWKDCTDFVNDIFTSDELRLSFDMEYKIADTRIPTDIIFDSTDFVGPKRPNSAATHVVSIDRNTASATKIHEPVVDVVTQNVVYGCIARTVQPSTTP